MIATPKITPKKRQILETMGIVDGMDILLHYPFRYEVIESRPFSTWQIGDKVTFEGRAIRSAQVHRFGKNRSVTRFSIMTDDEVFEVSIFNRPWLRINEIGQMVTVFGRYDGQRKITAMQVNFESLASQLGLQPIYSLKEGITLKYFRSLVQEAWEINRNIVANFIPAEFIQKYKLMARDKALFALHFSQEFTEIENAIRTMKYEEFLRFQLVMQTRKNENKSLQIGSHKVFDIKLVNCFIDTLPYELTSGQNAAVLDVLGDLQNDAMMYRMLQGDVGCGKTIVAVIGMYATVLANYQAAIMVPTEILAKQHYQNITKMFEHLNLKTALLVSALSKKEKDEIYFAMKNHQVDIVIGTHALFQEQVEFAKLGLIVTDEQQRFGVNQRQRFVQKGERVDVLMMSATPIPRTLATTLFGDMDVSTIKELPSGKKKIITSLIKENSIRSIQRELEKLLDEKNQAYMVCAAIEKNEDFEARNVLELAQNLANAWQGKYKVDVVHGKLKQQEKDVVIERFLNKEFDVLVTTTVVEVGVDIKNANVMIVYDAHRFGLSQLHQLRGRVGRSSRQGYCYLLTNSKDAESLKRLEILVQNTDGFEIALEDLKLRGPGDILGTRQSGIPSFILGDVFSDNNILEQSRLDAQEILKNLTKYPELSDYLLENSKKYSSYLD